MSSLFKNRTPTPQQKPTFTVFDQKTFGTYAWAYVQAARVLSQQSDVRMELIEFPVVYLYRHAIELQAKAILVEYGDRINISKREVLNRNHDLIAQLPDLERLASEIGGSFSDGFRSLLKELNDRDSQSMAFRYATKKDGSTSSLPVDFNFDIKGFIKGAEELLDELDTLETQLASIATAELMDELGIPR